jgi:hypothetical protein
MPDNDSIVQIAARNKILALIHFGAQGAANQACLHL